MTQLQGEEGLKLTAQQEMDTVIRQRVMKLMLEGEIDLAAQILIEHARVKLPDSHPSKNPGMKGVLEGEQVSQLSAFEQRITTTKDGVAFGHAVFGGLLLPSENKSTVQEQLEELRDMALAMNTTLTAIAQIVAEEHPGLMPALTKSLLAAKREQGILPALPQSVQKEDKSGDDFEDDE